MRRSLEDRFGILRAALAIAEERKAVSLDDLSQELSVSVEELEDLLEEMLYLEFRQRDGELLSESRAFLLDDGVLTVDEGHWLRDLDARRPNGHDAFRLLMTAMHFQAFGADPALDGAAEKLRALEPRVVLADTPPKFIELCEKARAERRVMRVRYRPESHAGAKDYELEPARVGRPADHWYMKARKRDTGEIRLFRIDRIITAKLLDTRFEPFETSEIEAEHDLDALKRTVRVRAERDALERIAAPREILVVEGCDDGTVIADVVVIGDHRVDAMLLVLGPTAELIDPPEARARRRELASEILAQYSTPE